MIDQKESQRIKKNVQTFCQCVFEPGDIIEIRLLPKAESSWHTARELSAQNGALINSNQDQNIYVGANPRKAAGGTKAEDVALARCLFADFDNVTADDVKKMLSEKQFPEPTIMLNSGHGIHCYWRLNVPINDMAVWIELQKRLIATLNSDKSIHDPPRIMRLPGYVNHKEPRADAKIVFAVSERRYDAGDIEKYLETPQTFSKPVSKPVSKTVSKPTDEKLFQRALKYIDAFPNYGEGERNSNAQRLGSVLLNDLGVQFDTIWPIVQQWNTLNKPPLSDEELETAFRNGKKYAKRTPGNKLADTRPRKRQATSELKERVERCAQYQLLSEVKPRKVEYLQPEVIPLRMITILVSQEGEGKSTLVSDIIAHITQGKPWANAPDTPNPKGSVILYNNEESTSCILVPRLIAMGADTSKVIDGKDILEENGEEYPFDIEKNIPELDKLVDEFPDTRLIVFDPITSYCFCNENSNSEVRKALKALVDFAERKNIAVLGLTHLNKKVDLGFINRTIGSRAWSSVPRMVWGIRTEQVEDEDGHKIDTDNRFLINIKCNIGKKPQGMKFHIGEDGCIIWDEERVNLTIDANCREKTSRINEAVDWLKEYLGNGKVLSTEVFSDGEAQGFGKSLLNRAKQELEIKPCRIDFSGPWYWRINGDQ